MPPLKDHGIDLTKGAGDAMIYLSTNRAPRFAPRDEGLINMTLYTTKTLATEVIGADTKAATRTLRKFLRDELPREEQPGKGGRYALNYTKPQLKALTKKFTAWETAQEAAKVARAAEMAKAAETTTAPITEESDIEDNPVTGPTDEEMAEMLAEGDDEDDTDTED